MDGTPSAPLVERFDKLHEQRRTLRALTADARAQRLAVEERLLNDLLSSCELDLASVIARLVARRRK